MGALASISSNYLGAGFFGGVYGYGAPVGSAAAAAPESSTKAPSSQSAASQAVATPSGQTSVGGVADPKVAALQSKLDQLHSRLQALTTTASANNRAVSMEAGNLISDLKQILNAFEDLGGASSADVVGVERDMQTASALQSTASGAASGAGRGGALPDAATRSASAPTGLDSQLNQLNDLLATLTGVLNGAMSSGLAGRAPAVNAQPGASQATGAYLQAAGTAPGSTGIAVNI